MAPSLQFQSQQQQQQFNELKKKEDINPFKFSPDVDFCALSQLDKREKIQVKHLFISLKKTNYLFEYKRNVNVCKALKYMKNYQKLNVL